MGKKDRTYILNFARTLMGQLGITENEVGIASYKYDLISAGIRQRLVERVFCDLRHCKMETLAKILSFGIMGTPEEQQNEPALSALQTGLEPCTMHFVHHWERNWIASKTETTEAFIRYMAATAVVAAMYDVVIKNCISRSIEFKKLISSPT